jgi:hypothetical protein
MSTFNCQQRDVNPACDADFFVTGIWVIVIE